MGQIEPAPGSLPRRSKRRFALAGIVLLFLTVAGGLWFWTGAELRKEGLLIGTAARDAVVLDRVSRYADATLYPDTDHFLGNLPRRHEAEVQEAIKTAKSNAEASVRRSGVLMLKGQARLAQEIFFAAEQEATLAAEPRGNWISFLSETTRQRTEFDKAKTRYVIGRGRWISGDDPKGTAEFERIAMFPVTRATQAELDEVWRTRAEEERRAKAAEAQKEAQLAQETGPDRSIGSADFAWRWSEDEAGSFVTHWSDVGWRNEVFEFQNKTPWRIYDLNITFRDSDWKHHFEEVGPKDGFRITFRLEHGGNQIFHPAPTFAGRFR